jgi:hypothetical protein
MLISWVLGTGCASSTVEIRGQRLGRVTLSYTDSHLYLITHHDAYPDARGASDNLVAYAGRVTGYACGADIWAETEYYGGYLGVLGYVEPISRSTGAMSRTRPMHLEVRDQHGERAIRGSIGDDIGEMFVSTNDRGVTKGGPGVTGDTGAGFAARSHTIDFAFSSSQLHGTIGSRKYDLHTDGADNLVGTVFMGGESLPFMLVGVTELWSMPPSDQAAILPLVLTCEDAKAAGTGLLDLKLPAILFVDFSRNHVVH